MPTLGIRGVNRLLVFDALLLFGLLGMTARPATDPDLWWHLRTGQWIVETGRVPHSDPFSFTRAGQPWVSHEWLSEVTFYELWKLGGPTALIIFSAVITTAGFMLLYFRCHRRCPGKRHWAAAAVAFGALASAPSWGVRPQMFTFTLASLLLWLVEAGEDRPKLLFWIPPLFLLWLNLHAGFALGPALLLAYGLGLLLETGTGNAPWQQAKPILFRVLLLLVACLALVPLNPSGAQLYRYPLDTLRSSEMRSFIGEWFSPNFHPWLYRPFLLVWLLVLTALATSRSLPRGRVIMPLLLTGLASLDAVRHIPIFILVAMPLIFAAMPAPSASLANSKQPTSSFRFRPLFNGAVIFLVAILAFAKLLVVIRNQGLSEADLYPQAAVAKLKFRTGDYSRRVFAYYDWGGYVIWKLYPEYRVFVDGRADLYARDLHGSNQLSNNQNGSTQHADNNKNDLLRQFQTAVQLHNGWQGILDAWNVDTVLVPPGCALVQGLLIDPGWHPAFKDSHAVIFVRTQAAAGQRTDISTDAALGNRSSEGRKGEKMFPTSLPNLRN